MGSVIKTIFLMTMLFPFQNVFAKGQVTYESLESIFNNGILVTARETKNRFTLRCVNKNNETRGGLLVGRDSSDHRYMTMLRYTTAAQPVSYYDKMTFDKLVEITWWVVNVENYTLDASISEGSLDGAFTHPQLLKWSVRKSGSQLIIKGFGDAYCISLAH